MWAREGGSAGGGAGRRLIGGGMCRGGSRRVEDIEAMDVEGPVEEGRGGRTGVS